MLQHFPFPGRYLELCVFFHFFHAELREGIMANECHKFFYRVEPASFKLAWGTDNLNWFFFPLTNATDLGIVELMSFLEERWSRAFYSAIVVSIGKPLLVMLFTLTVPTLAKCLFLFPVHLLYLNFYFVIC